VGPATPPVAAAGTGGSGSGPGGVGQRSEVAEVTRGIVREVWHESDGRHEERHGKNHLRFRSCCSTKPPAPRPNLGQVLMLRSY
jgi:hypothetical protein